MNQHNLIKEIVHAIGVALTNLYSIILIYIKVKKINMNYKQNEKEITKAILNTPNIWYLGEHKNSFNDSDTIMR